MAEFLQRDLRVNETTAALRALTEKSLARVAPVVNNPSYTTLPDGRVLDRAGKLVYTPKEEKRVGSNATPTT
jgi:hypothetical protein